MKKRLSIMLLVAVVAMSSVLFVGCGGMSGERITADEFVTAMNTYQTAISEGSFGMEIKMKMSQESSSVQMDIDMKIADGNKLYTKGYLKMTSGGTSMSVDTETYIDSTGNTTYSVTKENGKWTGKAISESISDIFNSEQQGAYMRELDNESFDILEFRNGRYYLVSDELADAGINGEYYYVFKGGKLTGMVADFKIKINDQGNTSVTLECKFQYSTTVNIPSYTIA